jgi:hypothetical protein
VTETPDLSGVLLFQRGADDFRLRSFLVAILIFVVLAVATLFPVWSAPGWPLGHEGNAFALRTHIYARHFSGFDLMPIWSSADASGFGSPMPLLYHKLFYMLAGGLALVTGSLKSADTIAVAILLVAGAAGLFLSVRALGGGQVAALIAGCALITANYTVTNWEVRGALAEFCGAMVVPWVFLFFVKTIQSGRIAIGLGISLGLLWLSHSVLAFYAALILIATYLVLAIARRAPWSILHPRTAWPAVLCFTCLVGPYLVLMAILGRAYDINRILSRPYRPVYQFKPIGAYLLDRSWRFGSTVSGLTVQLDHAMLALAAIGLCALAVRKPDGDATRERILRPILPFMLVAALGLLLQLRVTNPFYEVVPGAAFIQFPWRLLALITPSIIVVASYLADTVLPSNWKNFILGGAAAWMLVSCGAFVPLRDPRTSLEPHLAGVTFSGFREYEPQRAAPLAEIETKLAARWREAGCSFVNANTNNDEVLSVQLHTSCRRTVVLPLPLYASPLHTVTTSNQRHSQPCASLPEFPALCGAIIPAADGTVWVKLPNVTSLGGWAWRRLSGR